MRGSIVEKREGQGRSKEEGKKEDRQAGRVAGRRMVKLWVMEKMTGGLGFLWCGRS